MSVDADGSGRQTNKEESLGRLMASAKSASTLLKALSNENRLRLLCLLAEGEKSVSELEALLGLRQPAVSQQLARLRADDVVSCRRDGKTIHYALAREPAERVMTLLHEIYFQSPVPDQVARGAKSTADVPLP
jgi:DNA-binding transcriptional ArsR family regulator